MEYNFEIYKGTTRRRCQNCYHTRGAWVGNEFVSPLVGEYRAENYAKAVAAATEKTVEHNVILEKHGQKAQTLPVLDINKYVGYREKTDVLQENFDRLVKITSKLPGPNDSTSAKSTVALDKAMGVNAIYAASGESKLQDTKVKVPFIPENEAVT